MNLIIRLATTADANAITILSEQLGYIASEADTKKYITMISNSADNVLYVALIDDTVAGWMQLFYTVRVECAPFCEIAGLVVDEQYRGKGIGKALIRSAEAWAAERCSCLKVRTNVLRKNTHRFYQDAGFEEAKEQKVYEMKL